MTRKLIIATSAWLCLLVVPCVYALPTNNTEILAVPAPENVKTDGNLDDWDLSGTILSCPETAAFLDKAAVRSAAMYDAAGLYLSFRWVDPTPLENMVNPDEPGMHNLGWRSDCLQLRMRTDTQVHITAWRYKVDGKMAMDINYDQPVGPNRLDGLEHGARMAFVKNADGRGYVQEIFIPWKLLSKAGKVYQAGESFKLGLHFNWGKGDNKSARGIEWQDVVSSPQANRAFFWKAVAAWGEIKFSPTGKLDLSVQPWEQAAKGPDLSTIGPVNIEYQLPADGKVTLVIEDNTGRRIRNLVSAYPRMKGANVDRWDGYSDSGTPVPPGEYRWRGIYTPGIDIRYQLHLYPSANPPWRNADGTGGWGSDHSAPTDAAAAGDRVFLLYEIAEGGSALIACDLDGNKLWGHGNAFQGGGLVCSADQKELYYANHSEFTRVDVTNGKSMSFATGIKNLPTGLAKNTPPTGLAFQGDRLCVSSAARNLVRVFDLTTDKAIKDIELPSPMGLAFGANGILLAVSGQGVVQVDLESGQVTPLVATGLNKPRGLAIGPGEEIYVVNGGTNQVLVFSRDGKKLVREIGTRGGRPAVGPWDINGMYHPAGLGIDQDGNVWVAEEDLAAKRLSKWGRDGKNMGEWMGPSPYNGDGIVDHRDRSRIYCGGLEFAADWETGKSKPVYSHLRGLAEGQPASAGMIANGTFYHRQGFTTTYKGNDYLAFDRGLLCIRRGDAWVPCAAIGYVKKADENDRSIWSDRNADGKVQDDEIFDPAKHGLKWFSLHGAMNWGVLWSHKDLSTVRLVDSTTLVRFTPAEFTRDGIPLFDERSITTVKIPLPIDRKEGPVDVDDDVIVTFYEDSHAPWIEALRKHPDGDMSGIKAYSRSGKLLWRYPQRFSGVHGCFKAPLPSMPGEVIGTIYVMGVADMGTEIGKVLCFNGYYGQRFLFTTDGLFVDALFKDGRMLPTTPPKAVKDMLMNDMSPGGEAYAGTFSRNTNGEVYLTSSFAGPMCVVMKVEGLDKLQRLAGDKINLTAEQIAEGAVARRERETNEKADATPTTLMIARATPKVDGAFDEWQLDTHGVSIRPDERRTATAALAYDDKFLYAAFDVKDASPWKNAGNDPKVMFLFGDSVDIRLGLDPAADPRRQTPAAGDVRIAIAPQDGKPLVMLYRPIVPGHQGERVPFVSPVGRVVMDQVQPIAEAVVAVVVVDGGYRLEAAIPWSALGAKPAADKDLRGDLGVLFSDELGTECVLRAYWSNRDTNMTSDLPSEAKLQPHNWGKMLVK
jgi:hypothetical protein